MLSTARNECNEISQSKKLLYHLFVAESKHSERRLDFSVQYEVGCTLIVNLRLF